MPVAVPLEPLIDLAPLPPAAHKAEDEGVAAVEYIQSGFGHVNYGVRCSFPQSVELRSAGRARASRVGVSPTFSTRALELTPSGSPAGHPERRLHSPWCVSALLRSARGRTRLT